MSLACSQDASPLHAAVRMSDTAAIRAYLDAHPEQVDVASTSSGHTPLHEAVAGTKCLAAAKLLLSKGADPCAVDPRDGGMSPLHQAVANGDECEPIAITLLDNGADVNFQGKVRKSGHVDCALHVNSQLIPYVHAYLRVVRIRDVCVRARSVAIQPCTRPRA